MPSAEHPNASRIRALFAAFRNADLATIQETIAAAPRSSSS
jgi:hypothetical protein